MFGISMRHAMLLAMAVMATLLAIVPSGEAQACTTGSLAVVAPQDVRLGGGGRGVLPFRRNVRAQLAPRAAIIVPQQVIVPHSQTILVPQQQLIVPQQQTLLLVR